MEVPVSAQRTCAAIDRNSHTHALLLLLQHAQLPRWMGNPLSTSLQWGWSPPLRRWWRRAWPGSGSEALGSCGHGHQSRRSLQMQSPSGSMSRCVETSAAGVVEVLVLYRRQRHWTHGDGSAERAGAAARCLATDAAGALQISGPSRSFSADHGLHDGALCRSQPWVVSPCQAHSPSANSCWQHS